MTTTTLERGPARAELELALRAAVLAASPREHGRERAVRATRTLTVGLATAATAVAGLDLVLLVGAGA